MTRHLHDGLRAAMMVKKVTYFGELGYLNSDLEKVLF